MSTEVARRRLRSARMCSQVRRVDPSEALCRTDSVRAFCLSILSKGQLGAKLVPPRAADGGELDDRAPGAPLAIRRPARAPELALAGGSEKLPAPAALGDPEARGLCLARFAHHELMAVELFAWALLRWPGLDASWRRAFLKVLEDEQHHCRLYLERLQALDRRLEEYPCSDYFWRQADAVAASDAGPRAFLCALGLTLEQANLDFSLRYRDAFRAAGDVESARVLERVHRDEIRHVAMARRALEALDPDEPSEVERYRHAVPFPLSAARAKGRPFRSEPRRRAGLGEPFIEFVRRARSRQELASAPAIDRDRGPRP